MPSLKKASIMNPKSSSIRNRGALLFVLLPLLFSCAGEHYTFSLAPNDPQENLSESPLRILVASDLHYLEPSLTDNGALFQRTIANADSKLTDYSSEILEAFLAEVKKERPSALCLTGDLTFNGEKLSHKSLATFLTSVRDLGIAVLVIPGNHDIDSPYAYSYEGNGYSTVANVSASDFLKIYADVTFKKALSFDEKSLSYVYPLRKDAWVLALSADGDSSERGIVPSSTLAWAEKELKQAQEKGIKVFSLTHESLLLQNENFTASLIHNAGEVSALFKKYGVIANASGHLHIQHFAVEDQLADLVTSSLVVAPFHYASIDWTSSSLTYQSHNLDVASYAQSVHWSDPNLLDLTAYGKQFFYASNEKRIRSRLSDSDYSATDIEKLVESYLPLNYDYYQGIATDESLFPEGYALWKASTFSFSRYVKSMLASDKNDFNFYQKNY
jgi:3',5'-cyclic AMP phosphodiesterase CpdA